jgi:signal transduction histidine kinase
MNHPLAAAIAFFAFGVLFLGSVLMLLFNPRSREVRWWVAFQIANLVWLGAQGVAFAAGMFPQMLSLLGSTTHVMAGLFVAFAVSDEHRWPRWAPWVPVALALALLPVLKASVVREFMNWLPAAWHIGMWGLGTVLLTRSNWKSSDMSLADSRLLRMIVGMLVVVAPVALIGGVWIGHAMWAYAMPLLVVWIQIILFIGVARLRFYDIEVRAARTGDLAAEAAEQERLAVLGELSASLAHEIRNPLTGVRSLAQRLSEEEIEPVKRRRYAHVILEEVDRLERLVANLLGMARREPKREASAKVTDVAGLFADLALLLRTRAERARVRLVPNAVVAQAEAPREALAQALLNLLLNAIRHAPPGSAVHLLSEPAAGGIRLVVRDEGEGVRPADRERIFEPFYSGAGGTGLGLAVVRRLVREHGWTIELEDAPGGGAEFRLVVPSPDSLPIPHDTAGGAPSMSVTSTS